MNEEIKKWRSIKKELASRKIAFLELDSEDLCDYGNDTPHAITLNADSGTLDDEDLVFALRKQVSFISYNMGKIFLNLTKIETFRLKKWSISSKERPKKHRYKWEGKPTKPPLRKGNTATKLKFIGGKMYEKLQQNVERRAGLRDERSHLFAQ